ncbi:hypothetical protein [Paenibacillus xylanivorans]|uniref:hypothetical protein n=1 Tax=Paenibacillus xylanivorans TaxID=1705561 RepID=UPI0011876A31|nr:hypothetical protein [Paenibacillus xylanivorans]
MVTYRPLSAAMYQHRGSNSVYKRLPTERAAAYGHRPGVDVATQTRDRRRTASEPAVSGMRRFADQTARRAMSGVVLK